jgi:hypothetical protein
MIGDGLNRSHPAYFSGLRGAWLHRRVDHDYFVVLGPIVVTSRYSEILGVLLATMQRYMNTAFAGSMPAGWRNVKVSGPSHVEVFTPRTLGGRNRQKVRGNRANVNLQVPNYPLLVKLPHLAPMDMIYTLAGIVD